MEKEISIIYSNTLNELRVLINGLHHDHCHHLYFGLSETIPEHLKSHVIMNDKYVFIYYEDIPPTQSNKKPA